LGSLQGFEPYIHSYHHCFCVRKINHRPILFSIMKIDCKHFLFIKGYHSNLLKAQSCFSLGQQNTTVCPWRNAARFDRDVGLQECLNETKGLNQGGSLSALRRSPFPRSFGPGILPCKYFPQHSHPAVRNLFLLG
jgi:hypothetical protein